VATRGIVPFGQYLFFICKEDIAMLDMKFLRENVDSVKENMKKKFQEHKLELVDKVVEMDKVNRQLKQRGDDLRAKRNAMSKEIGGLMAKGLKDEANAVKAKVQAMADEMKEIEEKEAKMATEIKEIMMKIPNMIDPSVPIGKDDSENVELQKYGEPIVPAFEIPYHTEIMERFNGIDLDSARKVAGNGFYYLMGDIARLHSAVISYARDFMIERGFTYVVPPFMIRSNVVTGVMSFAEMEGMMYKIEGEDLYLIGTSEHSMIGKFIDTILDEKDLPYTYTSYSPCFRKEKGAHGIEERGVYRIHQFEKQEMIVVCKPEESADWFVKLYTNTVDLFRSLDIPVRTLECCSGDLADLKCKSVDVEAWSPRQKKYFEVGSCSNLTDAQARRLGIRVKGKDGKYFAHTLNNTVVAPPRMLIAFLENNLNEDGSVNIPKVLQPYMGGTEKLVPKK
jgi:seryl-tRNA synthetase